MSCVKWPVSFCSWMENGWIIMREDGSFRNEFPDEQIAFKKYEEFKKNILISMLIFLVCLKNCYLLFHYIWFGIGVNRHYEKVSICSEVVRKRSSTKTANSLLYCQIINFNFCSHLTIITVLKHLKDQQMNKNCHRKV